MTYEEILSQPISKTSFCVLDVETTGLSPQYNNIIELGIVRVKNLKIVDRFHSVINPGREIPAFITGLTGITNEEVYDAPFFEDIVDKVIEFIGEDVIAGHNLSFDKSFLKREFNYCGRSEPKNPNLCTLKVSRRIFPMLSSKSLGAVSSFLKIKNHSSHRALGDAETTAKILIKIAKHVKKNLGFETLADLINLQFVPVYGNENGMLKNKLLGEFESLPDAPGVYYFLNSKGKVVYIGKAKSLRERIKSYFSDTAPRKAKKIIKSASKLKIELTNSELTALLKEAESIKSKNPRWNVQLKKYGNKYFLRVNSTHKFPDLEICNHFDFDGNDYFGLFSTRKKAESMFQMLNKTFAVRECSNKDFIKGKRCFLADIERCLAPCELRNTAEYFSELDKVYEFMYGKNQFALTRMINKMKDYSAKQKYENAQEVKEIIDLILAQTHKTSLLAEPVNKANVLFEINETFTRDYVLLLSGKIFIKKRSLKEKDFFEDALDDYFAKTIFTDLMPNDEDLEKMKITLNWLVKNRNKVRCFYLKEFNSKEELYKKLTSQNTKYSLPEVTVFDLKTLMNQN
ncbi:MAG: GIY-YIG nuclease family protein [Ignavibacteriaceae bacterium]|nr:GIY-YIG nuclease family protein [Ignavibacteriaceae bacterium]